ncbi:MAG: FKBP-type peptidyl-prolyl cis-trans isomerase [Phycisphaerales bacterium JB043]
MIRRSLFLVALMGILGASTALAQHDFTRVPILPKEMHAMIKGRHYTMAQMVEAAEAHVGGRCVDARWNFPGEENPAAATVTVITETEKHRVIVNGLRGDVISSEVVNTFPGMPTVGQIKRRPSGLMYYELKEGDGPEPPTSTSKVLVHYTGYFNNGVKFDSSYDRNEPIEFPLNQVIRGWGEGVGSMKVGGIRKLIIPADLGYGEQGIRRGAQEIIPPNALLIFDVELIDITDLPEEDSQDPVEEAGGDGSE